jgi:hypothetical protein
MGEGRKGRACLGLVFTGEVSTRIRRRGWCGGALPPGEEREQEGRDLGLGRRAREKGEEWGWLALGLAMIHTMTQPTSPLHAPRPSTGTDPPRETSTTATRTRQAK